MYSYSSLAMSSKERERKPSAGKRKREPIEKKEYKGKSTTERKFSVSVNDIKNAHKRQEAYELVKRAKSKKKFQEKRVKRAEREALGEAVCCFLFVCDA
jgi:hypothetical protein